MSTVRSALEFLRMALTKGWRPVWRAAGSVLGLTFVGAVVLVRHASPLWLLVAALVVLLVGSYYAFAEQEHIARVNAHKAAQTDLLRKQHELAVKELAVSQAQYEVLSDVLRGRCTA